jgi:hypothetical protein
MSQISLLVQKLNDAAQEAEDVAFQYEARLQLLAKALQTAIERLSANDDNYWGDLQDILDEAGLDKEPV